MNCGKDLCGQRARSSALKPFLIRVAASTWERRAVVIYLRDPWPYFEFALPFGQDPVNHVRIFASDTRPSYRETYSMCGLFPSEFPSSRFLLRKIESHPLGGFRAARYILPDRPRNSLRRHGQCGLMPPLFHTENFPRFRARAAQQLAHVASEVSLTG